MSISRVISRVAPAVATSTARLLRSGPVSRLAFAPASNPPLLPAPPHPLGLRFSSKMADSAPSRRLRNPVIFVCDLQDKFRAAISHFDKILLTTQKVLRAAQILEIPVMVTTQNQAKLGPVVAELQPLLKDAAVQSDKTLFSMLTPEIVSHELFSSSSSSSSSSSPQRREVAIVGIESHICVTQTALDLLARGHAVYVLADGVSSCNDAETPIALARLRAAGAVVTTSESWIYEVMGDAGIAAFRDVARLVKETAGDTREALKRSFSDA
ncbi:Isochorismatase-like protein [Nemania sp. NC0429]|nr:Isochorismatase-like protein [Nemania sp. NC0429]